MSQNTLNILVEKVNEAKTMDDCFLIDAQCVLLAYLSGLESDLKVPPTEIGGYVSNILGCTNLDESGAIQKELQKKA